MTTRTVAEITDELNHLQSELAILEAAKQREAGIVPEREAAAQEARAAADRAQAALFAAGEIVNGILMLPYGDLSNASPAEYADARRDDPDLPTPAEIARFQRRYAEAREARRETREAAERAMAQLSTAQQRADYLGRQISLFTNGIAQLEAERQRARALAGTPPPSRRDLARAQLARLRQAFGAA